MRKEILIDSIIEKQKTVERIIHENYHKLAQRYDLSLDQFHLLLELEELMLDIENEAQAPTIGVIAKNVNVSQNTVSERITRLEKKGYVSRLEDKKDRRISHVVLTESGRDLLRSINEEAETGFVKTALLKMGEDVLADFLTCYDKLISGMLFDDEKKQGEI